MSWTHTYLHNSMTEMDALLNIINEAFPVSPQPPRFFLLEHEASLDLDIPRELKERIAGRSWTHVTLLDWRMIGASPMVARRYLEPATFLYYVPSIIVGAFQETAFIDFALEAIIPDNKTRIPRGKWWHKFSAAITLPQRAALSASLSYIRLTLWDSIGLANQSLLEHAETIWNSRD